MINILKILFKCIISIFPYNLFLSLQGWIWGRGGGGVFGWTDLRGMGLSLSFFSSPFPLILPTYLSLSAYLFLPLSFSLSDPLQYSFHFFLSILLTFCLYSLSFSLSLALSPFQCSQYFIISLPPSLTFSLPLLTNLSIYQSNFNYMAIYLSMPF